MEHPLTEVLKWLPECDFAVLDHGFAPYGRDYNLIIEHSGIHQPGRHRLLFTHVVELSVRSEVRDSVWSHSWEDVFTDYAAWEAAGAPDGYVWGCNWSLAYPGIEAVVPSSKAAMWTDRVQHPMHEITLTTDRFRIELVFHSLLTEKIDDRVDLISRVIIPLK
jgi:hypothetical protein